MASDDLTPVLHDLIAASSLPLRATFKTSTKPVVDLHDSAWGRMYHRFAYEPEAFLARYHKRSNVETAFSMIKTKFGDVRSCRSPRRVSGTYRPAFSH